MLGFELLLVVYGVLQCINAQEATSCLVSQDREFLFFATPLSFDDAQANCISVGAELALVKDQITFDFIHDFRAPFSSDFLWIGLFSITGESDPNLFTYLDETTVADNLNGFGQTSGENPWDIDKPEGALAEGSCVAQGFGDVVDFFTDEGCILPSRYICERSPCESLNPTISPAAFPTVEPTTNPTVFQQPTRSPSLSPSELGSDPASQIPTTLDEENILESELGPIPLYYLIVGTCSLFILFLFLVLTSKQNELRKKEIEFNDYTR